MNGIYETLLGLFTWNALEREVLQDQGDSPLIQKYTNHRRITVRHKTLKVRTFTMPHHSGHKFPSLPLVLFIHGLGGQLNQFEPLIEFFSHFATVVSLDLPGHGQSEVSYDWDVYESSFLIELIEEVLKSNTTEYNESTEVVLIGHSMGTVLAARVAQRLGDKCIGLIAICPLAPIDPALDSKRQWLRVLPRGVFDIFRSADRVGGLQSKSVTRQVGKHASDDMRRRQLRWNLQVQTPSWMRGAYGFEPTCRQDWAGVSCPMYLIGAAEDQVTPPDTNLAQIVSWISGSGQDAMEDYFESEVLADCGHACMIERPEVVCGKVGDFINKYVDKKLSLSWQLAFLASKMDKWSLKNEAKWRRTQNVGDVVASTPFRGMKTLRQDDKEHCPQTLERQYPDITDIIDISREQPPYDPKTFSRIIYHKFPTVSKIPPTRDEVVNFNRLVEECLERDPHACIAVHCHYGFNRTGFFITSFMINRLGFGIKQAIDAFKASRQPGIKHPHFIDELYVRYDI